MKLPVKLTICYFLTAVVIFLIVNLLGTPRAEQIVFEDKKTEYTGFAEQLADEYAEYYMDSALGLYEVTQQLKAADEMIGARIWLVNSKHTVLVDTRGTIPLEIDNYSEDFLNNTFVDDAMFGNIFTEPMMSFIAPVIYEYQTRAYICIHVPKSVVTDEATDFMDIINLSLLAVMTVILLSYIAVYLLVAYPTRRIRSAALEYARGNYDYPLDISTHDELGDLANSVRYMVGEIRNVDDYQKKFIANISHDFRSPLTSIKGYAEAMKDGTIPYELQGRYLDIILFEADRLTKLTTNLLDLNRMDSQGVMLDISGFDINQVIKNVAAAFEGTCRDKKIVIELEFAEFETKVDADMGRIQQVLYNLTDNAIKFSNPDSRVEIETEEKGGKVLIRVRDHGAGIPKDNIKKIWERFYKTDTSRGKDKKGTGLGLSIVKEIITAHGENISVISTEGVGTEFTFSLPLSEG